MVKKIAKITEAEVRKVAALARLDLSDKEVETYAEQLSAILGYVGELQSVDTDNVKITSQVTGLSNVMREDKVEAGDKAEALINMAPESKDGLIKVKAVFNNGS